jgi:hypothetical protein
MLSNTYLSIYLVLWQKGLVEREINELLRGLRQNDDNERNKSNNNRKPKVNIIFPISIFDTVCLKNVGRFSGNVNRGC